MRLEFGSRPEDMVAAIGPGIGACCYAVGDEVRMEFESQFSYAFELFSEAYDSDPVKEKYPMLFLTARAPGHSNIGPALHLDLVEANRPPAARGRSERRQNLRPGRLHQLPHRPLFFPPGRPRLHRRSLSVIGIQKKGPGVKKRKGMDEPPCLPCGLIEIQAECGSGAGAEAPLLD